MNFIEEIRLRKNAGFGALKVVTKDEVSLIEQMRKEFKKVGVAEKIESGFTPGHITICLGMDDAIEDSAKVRRALINEADQCRKHGSLIILLGPDDDLHPDLASTFSIVKHPLPEPSEHEKHFAELVRKAGLTVEMHGALRAVRGLTSTRQEDAFALGIVDAKKRKLKSIDLSVLRRYKESEIGDLGYLRVAEPTIGFDDIKGHDYLKEWLLTRALGFTERAREAGLPHPRGLLAVGPPGTGKSRMAEATAFMWGCPYLTLDVGAAMGKYLGESEANINHALEVAERVSPCVLLIDEVDYALGQGGGSDDGTTGRVVGKILTWLAAKTEPVFVYFTSNRPWLLPPAMTRKGRLDEIFCVDFPDMNERVAILTHYLKGAKVEQSPLDGHMDENWLRALEGTADWSGAEIEAAVYGARFAAFADDRPMSAADLIEEIKMTTPVSQSQKEDVTRMREWAKTYARDSGGKSGD